MAISDEERRAELLRVVDDLLAQAAELRQQWEQIEALLDEGDTGEPDAADAPAPEQAESDPRLLVALDMALSGRTREETADYLRKTFGGEGIDAILAEVYDDAA